MAKAVSRTKTVTEVTMSPQDLLDLLIQPLKDEGLIDYDPTDIFVEETDADKEWTITLTEDSDKV